MKTRRLIANREDEITRLEACLDSVTRHASELQKLMMEEKEDFERRGQKLAEETGMLKTGIAWKERELEQINREKTSLLAKMKALETELAESRKSARPKIDWGIYRSRLSILKDKMDDFESLRNRIQSAFDRMSEVIRAQSAEITRLKPGKKSLPEIHPPKKPEMHLMNSLDEIAEEISDIHSSLENPDHPPV